MEVLLDYEEKQWLKHMPCHQEVVGSNHVMMGFYTYLFIFSVITHKYNPLVDATLLLFLLKNERLHLHPKIRPVGCHKSELVFVDLKPRTSTLRVQFSTDTSAQRLKKNFFLPLLLAEIK